jgi:hypothetical protein
LGGLEERIFLADGRFIETAEKEQTHNDDHCPQYAPSPHDHEALLLGWKKPCVWHEDRKVLSLHHASGTLVELAFMMPVRVALSIAKTVPVQILYTLLTRRNSVTKSALHGRHV